MELPRIVYSRQKAIMRKAARDCRESENIRESVNRSLSIWPSFGPEVRWPGLDDFGCGMEINLIGDGELKK